MSAREPGIAVPLIALAAVVIFGMTALVVDGGMLMENRRLLQNAVDGAALAGARYLPGNPNGAVDAAKDYLSRNGVNPDAPGVDIQVRHCVAPGGENDCITVGVTRPVSLFFAPVIRMPSAPVHAVATGIVVAANPGDLWPWGVPQACFNDPSACPYDAPGDYVALKVGARNNFSGNFMGLDFPGSSGGSDYEDSIKYGYDPTTTINLPWRINTETGNMSGPTMQGVTYLFQQEDAVLAQNSLACSPDPNTGVYYVGDCPTLGLVPIIQETYNQLNGKSQVTVVGFALFRLVDCDWNAPPGQRTCWGEFLHDWPYAITGGSSIPGGSLDGPIMFRLWPSGPNQQ
jgi:hypothetical protein